MRIPIKADQWFRAAMFLEKLYPEAFDQQKPLITQGLEALSSADRIRFGVKHFFHRFNGRGAMPEEESKQLLKTLLELAETKKWETFLMEGLQAVYSEPKLQPELKQVLSANQAEVSAYVRGLKRKISPQSYGAILFTQQATALTVLRAGRIEMMDHARMEILPAKKLSGVSPLPTRSEM